MKTIALARTVPLSRQAMSDLLVLSRQSEAELNTILIEALSQDETVTHLISLANTCGLCFLVGS